MELPLRGAVPIESAEGSRYELDIFLTSSSTFQYNPDANKKEGGKGSVM
jgi:hypothetical protein